MKNLYTKKQFLNYQSEPKMLNEGLFNFIGNMFNKAKGYINKVNGGKEIEAIYQKYIKIIEEEFKKKAQIELNLSNTQQSTNKQQAPAKPAETTSAPANTSTSTNKAQPNQQPAEVKKESVIYEAAPAAPTTPAAKATTTAPSAPSADPAETPAANNSSVDLLKKKRVALENILKFYQDKALKEMDRVLAKYGGADKSPKLAIIIDNKKDEFKLAFLNAEINALEQGGDKVTANKYAVERNKLAKSLDSRWNLGQKILQVITNKKYMYHNSKNQDVPVTVVGKAIGQDENGKADTTKPEYAKMWKVKTDQDTFWVDPASIKKEVTPEKAAPPAQGEKAAPTAQGEKAAPPAQGEKAAPPAQGEKAAPPAQGEKAAPAPAAGKVNFSTLNPEQQTQYKELKRKWIEEQKKAGKNTEPGQGTRDKWYKEILGTK